jgi:D-threo-aldose 1-dehydrogenase
MTLKCRTLGHTGLFVTELGFGSAPLGNLFRPLADDAARATLAAALDAGLGYFDTAPFYGFGLSERRLGDALRGRDFVVSTKVGRLLEPVAHPVSDKEVRHGYATAMPFEPVFDYSYDAVMRSYRESLQRLGLARIDMLYIHDIGRMTHGAENHLHMAQLTRGGGLRALEELRDQGAIAGFGVGVNEVAACREVMDHARRMRSCWRAATHCWNRRRWTNCFPPARKQAPPSWWAGRSIPASWPPARNRPPLSRSITRPPRPM